MAAETINKQPPLPDSIKDDHRDVSDLWHDALKKYQGIVGFSLEPKFENVDAMISFGVKEMNNFHKFRHNEKKVDKLRTLFAANMDFIESGTQQLLSAATPAFPPAAAIGTAVTFMLSACRQVSADYDVVVVFFEDMNAFLQRIVILETRMPKYKAYQNCLMDVFTSFLAMCGFAHKYIELGRFKKWVQSLMFGEDSELGGARKDMDTRLARLQSATEFAILGNTEEIQRMSLELKQNQESHAELLQQQSKALGSIQDDTEHIRNDMSKLLAALKEQRSQAGRDQKKVMTTEQGKPPSAKRIRNTMPRVEGEIHEYHILKETLVPDTGTWIFSERQWTDWLSSYDSHDDGREEPESEHQAQPKSEAHGPRQILALTGEPGMGKSHMAAIIFDKLWEKAAQDETKHTCASHFYFRENHQSLSIVKNAVITIINQVAEQSGALCERINEEYLKDEVVMDLTNWKDLANNLLAACFLPGSKYRLYLVLDGVDELSDTQALKEFLGIVKERHLNISIVVTGRPSILPTISDTSMPVVNIEVTKQKQMDDFKSFVWNRINSLTPLKSFGRYVKQSVADKVVQMSPNMLYAEHLLSRWNSLRREGAILRSLNKPLPSSLHEVYEFRLDDCFRRTETRHHHLVKLTLHLVAYSFRSLNLDEVTSLLRQLTKDPDFEVDEIPEAFTYFLRVGDPGSDAEARASARSMGGWQTSVKDLEKGTGAGAGNPENIYSDGTLPVKFQERSMRSFFRHESSTNDGRHWTPSEAHRQIFLTAARLARPVGGVDTAKLRFWFQKYATHYVFSHWRQVKPSEHSLEEQAEVMQALWSLLTSQHDYAFMVEWNGSRYQDIFGTGGFDNISQWAALLRSGDGGPGGGVELDEAAGEWWRGLAGENHKQALLPMAKAHLDRLYKSVANPQSISSFNCLKNALETSGLTILLRDQGAKNFPTAATGVDSDGDQQSSLTDRRASLGIPGLFDVEMGGLAYHAIADLLLHFNQRAPAEEMCRKALELLDETKALEQFKARVLMAKILLKRGHAKKAYELVASISDKLDTEGIPPVVKRAALVTKARVELRRHDKAGAAKSYAEARAADPSNLTAGDVLEEELDLNYKDYKEEEYRGVIATLKAWTPLEKLAFLTWDYEDMADGRHDMLLDVAATTGEVDYMIKVYEEAIKYLDNVNAGAPLRLWLVKLYLHVTEDLERARKALDEIFGSTSTGWPYAVTDEAPDYTLEEALSVQSNVMFQLFMASSDPVVKRELLESAKGLTTRPLALAVPPDSDTFILDYRINVARMHLKMGPAEEFQRLMQKIIDACIEALADKVGWNDSRNLVSLGQALFILAKAVPDGEELMRVAKIFSSARFSHLSSSSMSDDNSDRGSESGSGSDTESDYSDGSEGSNWSEGVSESKSVEEGATGEGDKGDAHERVDGKEGDEKTPTPDEGDMGDPDQVEWSCDGRCIPTLTYAAWEGRIAYQCHTCVAFLCPGCYEALIAHNRGETPIRGRKYCGKDHEYIKLPIEGWRGIEDGIIHIDGEEDIPFTDLLTKVKDELCKKAWDSFWRGE